MLTESVKTYKRSEVNWKKVSALLDPGSGVPGEYIEGQSNQHPKWDVSKAVQNSACIDQFKEILGTLVDVHELDSEKLADEEVGRNRGKEDD